MKVTKIKAGEYQVTAHGFVFTLIKYDHWNLFNKAGTQVMRDTTKTAILNALNTYNGHDFESLDTQEWAGY